MVTSGRVTLDGLAFVELVAALGSALDAQRDTRQAHKVSYALSDAGLAAFAVFFMQSPSFLAFQRSMLASSGASNAQTLFDMRAIPTDTHVRNLLDGVPSEALFVLFRHAYRSLLAAGALNAFRTSTKRLLVVIDGTEYFSSDRVHCAQCSTREHAGGVRYAHSVITPVIASPNQREVISLEPAFISPQDGELKQDCELNAARRWLRTQAPEYELGAAIVIADDLYSHQPFCQAVLDAGHDFVLVCKPQSHRTLTEYLELGGVTERTERSWNGRHGEIRAYRFASGLPLRDGNAALLVNWCELSVTHETSGQQLYRNSFITSLPVSASNVADVIAWGRCRWKIENENNNTLKTKGYHFEHNYGHGQQGLSAVLLTLMLYAFLCHTIFALTLPAYQQIRARLGRRDAFFNDVRALTRYHLFASWTELLAFMMRGLELTLDSS